MKRKEDTIFDLQENSKDEYEAEENILMYVFMCVCVPIQINNKLTTYLN